LDKDSDLTLQRPRIAEKKRPRRLSGARCAGRTQLFRQLFYQRRMAVEVLLRDGLVWVAVVENRSAKFRQL